MKKLLLLTLLTTTLLGTTTQAHFHTEKTEAHNCTLCEINTGITLEKTPITITNTFPILSTTIHTTHKFAPTKKTPPNISPQRAPPQLSLI